MEHQGNEIHVSTEEARGGRTMNVVRFVLAISLLLAIVALALVWAATRSSAQGIGEVSAPAPSAAHREGTSGS